MVAEVARLWRRHNVSPKSGDFGYESSRPVSGFASTRGVENSICNLIRGFAAGDFDGVAFFEISEPGVLAFGELPGFEFDPRNCVLDFTAALEVIKDLPVPEGLEGRVAEPLGRGQQAADFFDQSLTLARARSVAGIAVRIQ